MNPRILIPVSHPVGGIRTYMLYNLSILNRAGCHFTFLSAEGQLFDNFKKDVADWDGVEFIDVPNNGSAKETFFVLRKALSHSADRGGFGLIHSQGLRSGTIVCAANYFMRIPHVITLHDVIVKQNDIPGKFKGLKKFVTGFLTRRASVIVPVSNDCAENHLQHFPVWKKGPVRVQPILNGIDAKKHIPTTHYPLPTTHSLTTLGFFGRFMPQKGFDILLKALQILDERGYGEKVKLLATIDRHGYTNETLKEVEKNPVLKKMIHFIESVSDIMPLWQKVDALVMPSRWEACPLLPMEAMIAGVTVIGSDCLGLREVLAGSPNVAPPNGNSEALADAIIDFIEHKEQRKTEAQQFAPTAIERFDVRDAAEKLRQIYENCLHLPLTGSFIGVPPTHPARFNTSVF